MQTNWTDTRDLNTVSGAWSGWTQVSPKGFWFLQIAIWWRRRDMRSTWQQRSVTGGCRRYYSSSPDRYPAGSEAGPHPTDYSWTDISSHIGPWTPASRSWVEQEFQFRWFDPPDHLPTCRYYVGPNAFLGDRLRIDAKWLAKLKGAVSAGMTLDGEDFLTDRYFPVNRLRLGHHVIDIAATATDGTDVNAQFAFSVLDPISVVPEESSLRHRVTKSGPNGFLAQFQVRNGGHSDALLRVQPLATPPGWKALVVGEPVFVLAAGKSKRLTLQAELMNDRGLVEEVSFGIGATLWPAGRTVTTTQYVRLAADKRLLAHAREGVKRMDRKRLPLVAGSADEP